MRASYSATPCSKPEVRLDPKGQLKHLHAAIRDRQLLSDCKAACRGSCSAIRETAMEYRRLGGSRLKVPALMLGTATFGWASKFLRKPGVTDVRESDKHAVVFRLLQAILLPLPVRARE